MTSIQINNVFTEYRKDDKSTVRVVMIGNEPYIRIKEMAKPFRQLGTKRGRSLMSLEKFNGFMEMMVKRYQSDVEYLESFKTWALDCVNMTEARHNAGREDSP